MNQIVVRLVFDSETTEILTESEIEKAFSSACSSDKELPDISPLNKEVNQIGSIENATS